MHQDFMDYTAIEQHFDQQDACFFCIGVYTGQVPAAAFKKITVDYTHAFTSTLHKHSPQASVCFLSGAGADATAKSRILFAREKGIAENNLLRLGFAHTYIFRPGYIYPVTPRKEPNTMYSAMRWLYKPLTAIYPNMGLSSVQLANSMVAIGLKGGEKTIYENKDIRAYSAGE